MNECRRPIVTYPTRVPLKIIGHAAQLNADMMARIILEHLGPQPDDDRQHTVSCKGAYTCFTFWVTLPDANAEEPLRKALHALPGVIMQL